MRSINNIAFRVDATKQIGTGHFMRCLTLGAAMKDRGAEIRFVSRDLPNHLREMLAAKDIDLVTLESGYGSVNDDGLTHANWLKTSQAVDADLTIQALSGIYWDWLVVDHYALDVRWESALRVAAKQIMVIDDLADRAHDCEVLLDQNLYADMEVRYDMMVSRSCKLLLGPKYALLREEFSKLHQAVKPRIGPVKKVLVFFGGVDANNYTGRALVLLKELEVKDIHIDVVIGVQHPYRTAIEELCRKEGFVCHVQTNKIAELMATADLAIGAGGLATWERCSLGLPTIAVSCADNQHKQILDAGSEGLIYSIYAKDDWSMHIRALIANNPLRKNISQNGMKTVDGRGVLRVLRELGTRDVELRFARLSDSHNLFQWRNHPAIRRVARSTGKIDWETHQNWFLSKLSDKKAILLIGERSGAPVGVVRFDMQIDEAEISIYLVPGVEIPGLGRDLLLSAERWLMTNQAEIKRIRAHVLATNDRSRRLFVGAAYQSEFAVYSKRIR